MTYHAINELIACAQAAGQEGFPAYEEAFFMLFYNRFQNARFMDIPDVAFLYMEISNWKGMSARCGVWQYYESGAFAKGKFERVLSFLKTNGEAEMADIYACGIHDYANERYQQNQDYPEEWLEEANRIDEWISGHEKYIDAWLYDLILTLKK